MKTLERTFTLDRDLVRRADRKLHRYGRTLDDAVHLAFTLVLGVRGDPFADHPVHSSTSFDALDSRLDNAMSCARVRRMSDGSYRASTPAIECFYSEGPSRSAALAELREDARWLLADPVIVTFSAHGRKYFAEVRAERLGGYSASVPELPGCCTCGDTMDDIRAYLVEAAEGWLDAHESFSAAVS